MSEEEAVRSVVRRIHESWRDGRYDEMGQHLAEDVVIAPPGVPERIRGRDAYVQSYRDYDRMATTHEFEPEKPTVDVTGETAVALCPFFVRYELDGRVYREKGIDLLVLSRSGGEWRVVWRTMQREGPEPDADGSPEKS